MATTLTWRWRSAIAISGLAAALLAGYGAAAPRRAAAETLFDALALAFQTNPTLRSEIAALRATNEQIPQALANSRPSVSGTATGGREWNSSRIQNQGGSIATAINPADVGINVSQPLYTGGGTEARLRQAESTIQATRANVVAAEQQVLFNAASAYMNVVRDQAVLELQINNEQVLQRQLTASRDRFAVGEITRTDVSQSESRLAGATAQRIQAEGNLRSTRANYERVIGVMPGTLVPPRPLSVLPGSLEETISLAEANSPSVITAQFTQQAAANAVDVARSALLPQLSLSGQVRRDWNATIGLDRRDSAAVLAQVTVPLYQAGAEYSRVRQARETAGQRSIDLEDSRRAAIEGAIGAWETLVTARASIESLVSQVRSAEIALEGVRQEAQVGSRTVLDVLNAEQELLNARVSLVRSQRDEVVAGFQLLGAVGQLTARNLTLPVEYYDFDRDYNATRNRWWGTSIDGQ